jgi:dolichol-phosphate mannosyltransferase
MVAVRGASVPAVVDFSPGAASLPRMPSLLRKADDLIERLPLPPRLVRFCMVGASGVFVNLAALGAALALLPAGWGAWQPRAAQAAGILVSILMNFALNDRWTWSDRASGGARNRWRRLGRFVLVSALAALLQWGASVLLHERLGLWIYLAQALGIVLALGVNFSLNHLWTFGHRHAPVDGR